MQTKRAFDVALAGERGKKALDWRPFLLCEHARASGNRETSALHGEYNQTQNFHSAYTLMSFICQLSFA